MSISLLGSRVQTKQDEFSPTKPHRPTETVDPYYDAPPENLNFHCRKERYYKIATLGSNHNSPEIMPYQKGAEMLAP